MVVGEEGLSPLPIARDRQLEQHPHVVLVRHKLAVGEVPVVVHHGAVRPRTVDREIFLEEQGDRRPRLPAVPGDGHRLPGRVVRFVREQEQWSGARRCLRRFGERGLGALRGPHDALPVVLAGACKQGEGAE